MFDEIMQRLEFAGMDADPLAVRQRLLELDFDLPDGVWSFDIVEHEREFGDALDRDLVHGIAFGEEVLQVPTHRGMACIVWRPTT